MHGDYFYGDDASIAPRTLWSPKILTMVSDARSVMFPITRTIHGPIVTMMLQTLDLVRLWPSQRIPAAAAAFRSLALCASHITARSLAWQPRRAERGRYYSERLSSASMSLKKAAPPFSRCDLFAIMRNMYLEVWSYPFELLKDCNTENKDWKRLAAHNTESA